MTRFHATTAPRRRMLALLALLLPSLACAEISLPEPTQISTHVRAWIGPYGPPAKENQGFRMNLGFVVGDRAVAVIDSGYGDAMANAMLEQIAHMTDRPVRYVINTNSQPHRILGNAAFRKVGAEIIATAEATPRIAGEGTAMARTAEGILGVPPGSIQAPGTPERMIQDTLDLDLGSVNLKVIPVGTAHTAGSLVIEVVEDKVVFAGDVLYAGRLPSVLTVSRVDRWIAVFDRLRDFGNALFIPGHGEPGTLEDFDHSTYTYLTTLQAHMDQALDEGIELQEAIETFDQSPWQELADFDLLAGRNAHQTYLEREAVAFE